MEEKGTYQNHKKPVRRPARVQRMFEANAMFVPRDFRDETFWRRASVFQFMYSISGLVLGLACVIGGMVLLIHGIAGSTNWTAKILGLESEISDAAPGTLLFVVGVLIVWITRFIIKARK